MCEPGGVLVVTLLITSSGTPAKTFASFSGASCQIPSECG
jgi:hypothetical protein